MTVKANNELSSKTIADVVTEVREMYANMQSLNPANIDKEMQAFKAEQGE